MSDITLFKSEGNLFFKIVNKKEEIIDFNFDGIIINADEKECRRTIEFIKSKNKTMKIAVVGRDDEFNRRAIETLKINYLISPELTEQKDTLKQRASGMNNFIGKLAKQKNVEIIIGINFILNEKNKKIKAKFLSRIIQNVKICRKTDCKIKIASFAKTPSETIDEKQAQSIGFSIGMSSQQANACCEF